MVIEVASGGMDAGKEQIMARRMRRRSLAVAGIGGVAIFVTSALSRPRAMGTNVLPGATPALATPRATPTEDVLDIAIETVGVRFSPDRIVIPANARVRLVVTNRSAVHHDLVIPGLDRHMPRVGPGEVGTLLIRAEPGTYEFHCSIQSHHEAGMDGMIIAS